MSSASLFQVSTTLVVLGHQGSAMEILIAGRTAEGLAHLPQISSKSGTHPQTQASAKLQALGLPFTEAQLSLLEIHGFSKPGAQLSQGVMLWLSQPVPNQNDYQWVPLDSIHQFQGVDGALVCQALARFWTQMPTAQPPFSEVRPFGAGPDALGPAIFFGGSFHPWHRAHQACIELCPRPDRVIVVPDNNPQKAHQQRLCAWRTYRQLLDIVTPMGAHVFPGFCGMEYANPTVRWLPHTRYGQRHYLMGDDSFVTLPRWIEAEKLVKALDQLWIAPRRSQTTDIIRAENWLAVVAPQCKLTFLEDHDFRDLSSTAIRARSSNGAGFGA